MNWSIGCARCSYRNTNGSVQYGLAETGSGTGKSSLRADHYVDSLVKIVLGLIGTL